MKIRYHIDELTRMKRNKATFKSEKFKRDCFHAERELGLIPQSLQTKRQASKYARKKGIAYKMSSKNG